MVSSISSSTSLLSLQSARGAGSGVRPEKPDPRIMFDSLDANGDGTLSIEELKAAPEPREAGKGPPPGGEQGAAGPPTLEQRFNDLDGDGDGAVTFEEFAARRPPEPPQGPPAWLQNASGNVLSSLFATDEDAATGGLLAATA